jgi:hypothetical protein
VLVLVPAIHVADRALDPCAAQPGTMVRISVLNDALKSMFNAEKRGKRQVLIKPSSKVIIKFLSVMQKHGECGSAQSHHLLCIWDSHLVRFLVPKFRLLSTTARGNDGSVTFWPAVPTAIVGPVEDVQSFGKLPVAGS